MSLSPADASLIWVILSNEVSTCSLRLSSFAGDVLLCRSEHRRSYLLQQHRLAIKAHAEARAALDAFSLAYPDSAPAGVAGGAE